MKTALQTLSVALLLSTGCAIGPKHDRVHLQSSVPSPAPPATGSDLEWATAQPTAHLPKGEWWKDFKDPDLDVLVAKAMKANPGLAAAFHRMQEARAAMGVARSDSLPKISATPSLSRQRTSANSFDRGGPAGVSHTFSTYLLPLEAGWEPDLWGRVKNSVEKARAQYEAAVDDLEGARLSLQAEVAANFFAWRSLDTEIQLLGRMREAFQKSLDLTRNRKQGGIATELDVSRAETQLRAVEAQIPAVERRREVLVHAIAVLCGENPLGFRLEPSGNPPATGMNIPAPIASELLERRPDVAAAERRVAAANAEVGIARGAFYPRFRIHGLAGLQSVDAGTLFNAPSRIWAVGPSMEIPIFSGGRNRSGLEQAKSRQESAAAEYRQIALVAFREVADHLSTARRLQDQLEAERKAAEASRKSLDISLNRYRSGLVTFLEVATAQTDTLAHERTVTQIEGEIRITAVSLSRALGGGWSPPRPK